MHVNVIVGQVKSGRWVAFPHTEHFTPPRGLVWWSEVESRAIDCSRPYDVAAEVVDGVHDDRYQKRFVTGDLVHLEEGLRRDPTAKISGRHDIAAVVACDETGSEHAFRFHVDCDTLEPVSVTAGATDNITSDGTVGVR